MPSKAVPASQAQVERARGSPLAGSKAISLAPVAAQTLVAVVGDAVDLGGAGEGAVLAHDLGRAHGGLQVGAVVSVVVIVCLPSALRCGAVRPNLRERQRSRE